MKRTYLKPIIKINKLEMIHILAESGKPGGQGEDIPWGASKKERDCFDFSY